MTIDDMRVILGLGPEALDAAVVEAYAAYLEAHENAGLPALPTPGDLKARYPAFAAADDAVLTYWLTDAVRFVDGSWPIEADRTPAMLAVAAHNMARAGVAGSGTTGVPAGVTDFRSGAFAVKFSEAAVNLAAEGGYASTPYGQDYAALLARNKGGTRVTAPAGIGSNAGFNGLTGLMSNPAAIYSW